MEDPLAMHTTQVLLDKARRKDRIDRMLNDNPEHNIDPDVVLKPSGDQPPGLLDAGAPEESARTPSASASRLLKGPAALLALGVIVAYRGRRMTATRKNHWSVCARPEAMSMPLCIVPQRMA